MTHEEGRRKFWDHYQDGQWQPTAKPAGEKKWCLMRTAEDGSSHFRRDQRGRIVWYDLEGAYRKAIELQEPAL